MMKKTLFLLTYACFFTLVLHGQSGFNYQAQLRDGQGNPLTGTVGEVIFRILQGGPQGTEVYAERHTNLNAGNNGYISAVIGTGQAISGNFENIDWSSGNYYLSMSVNGSNAPASQLQSVPFSKIATDMRLQDLKDVAANNPANGQVLQWNGNEWVSGTVSGGPGGNYVAGTGIDINGNTISNTAPDLPVSLTAGANVTITGTYPDFTIAAVGGGGATFTAGTGIDITGTTITNTAPDQPVTLTAGANVTITGTYPNFTIEATGGGGTTYTAGTGIDITGTTITNTAPDQTVTLTAGANVTITGTYPNFTIEATGGGGTTYTAGTGIDITGTTITNTAPDQTVTLTAGANVTITGTYPNFTIEATGGGGTTYTAGTGIDITGTTITNTAPDQTVTLNEGTGIDITGTYPTFTIATTGGGASPWQDGGGFIYYNSGKVAIGDNFPGTTPTQSLHLIHKFAGTPLDGFVLQSARRLSDKWMMHVAQSDADGTPSNGTLAFLYNDNPVTRIQKDGTVNTLSDARVKAQILSMEGILDRVLQLQPRYYFHEITREHTFGFIAQEVQAIFPAAVAYDPGMDIYMLDYSKFSVLAIQAIKEQQLLLNAFGQQLKDQDARIRELERMISSKQE